MRSSLWVLVSILVFTLGHAGDAFLGSNTPDVEQSPSGQSENEDVAKKIIDKGTDASSPLELTTEDGLVAVSAKEPAESIASNSMDGAGAIGLLRQRLASEEQFNQRLQQLLAKSALETRNKQGQVVVLQEQLAVAMQSQQNVKSAFMKKIVSENTELTEERSHTKTLEKQLRKAGHMVDSEHKTITLLRDRMGTVLSHLRNVSHISKVMENELADAKAKESMKSHQLAAVQHEAVLQQRVPLQFEAKLHEVQAVKASDEKRLKVMEHQNILLRQRIASMNQRDKIFNNENTILRSELQGKAREEQKALAELEKVKASLIEARESNLALQDKYAGSLKALLVARGGGASEEQPLDTDLTSDATSPIEDRDPIKDASLLMQLKHDSKRLRSAMSNKAKSNEVDLQTSNTESGTSHEISYSSSSDALSHDSQGLTALLNQMSNATEKKVRK